MKKFNFTDFNVHGQEFISLLFKFDLKNGFTYSEELLGVRVVNNVIPAHSCDFVSNKSSCSSKNFYEVSSFVEPITLFFNPAYGMEIKEHFYCLPENKDLVVKDYSEKLFKFLTSHLLNERDFIDKALSLLNK